MTNDEYLQRILELIDEQPVCKSALRKVLCIGEQRCNTLLDRLVATNRAVPKAVGPHRYWHTPRLWTAMYGFAPQLKGSTPVVNLPDRSEWIAPAVTVTIKDGVKITRQSAPKGRYHVEMPKGSGAISRDWMARRVAEGTT